MDIMPGVWDAIISYLVTTILAGLVGALSAKGAGIRSLRRQIQSLIDSQKSMLYERMVGLYLNHHDKLGYMTVAEKESFERLYVNWTSLGDGSDVIKHMYDDIMRLPTENPGNKED